MILALLIALSINVWPGVAPGSEHATQTEVTYTNTPLGTVVINVTKPTLTAYLPNAGSATGTGVIIAPGGACVALTTDLEGANVARYLQKRGIAAFVLKYRTMEKREEGLPNVDMDTACQPGIADAIQSLKVLRQRSRDFHLMPGRLGIMGFSAGGMIAAETLVAKNAAARPNFAALLYGAPFGVLPEIPTGLPPTFMAWAEDDAQASTAMHRFYSAMYTAGARPEVHVYSMGGHGFGVGKPGTPEEQWPDAFCRWLQEQHLLPT